MRNRTTNQNWHIRHRRRRRHRLRHRQIMSLFVTYQLEIRQRLGLLVIIAVVCFELAEMGKYKQTHKRKLNATNNGILFLKIGSLLMIPLNALSNASSRND